MTEKEMKEIFLSYGATPKPQETGFIGPNYSEPFVVKSTPLKD